MSQATWAVDVTSLAPTRTAFLDIPQDLTYVRRINGFSEVEGTIVSPEDFGKVSVYTRAVRLWRNGTLRFAGQVMDPFAREPDKHEFVAKDPYAGLGHRRVNKLVSYSDTYTDNMAWNLISQANDLHTTFLRRGAHASTIQKDKSFHVGDLLAEQIDALSDIPGSFWFRVDPVDGVANVLGEFITLADGSLNDKSDRVIFAFGQDNYDNCTSYRIEEGLIRNRTWVYGTKHVKPAVANAKASWATHGLWEDERGHVTTNDATMLDAIAKGRLITSPCRVFSVTPGPDAPAPFDDFDVGDVVNLRVNDRGFSYTGNTRITEFTVKLDPNSGEEILQEIVMEESSIS